MQPRNNPLGASRQDHEDFVDRFSQGPQAVSDEDAASRYEQVAPNLPPDVYQQSAQEVFAQVRRCSLGLSSKLSSTTVTVGVAPSYPNEEHSEFLVGVSTFSSRRAFGARPVVPSRRV
jgi:hypothetical protein